MNKQTAFADNFSSLQNIQAYLSLGYIYLIVMGIINETLFYRQIGVEILSYSSILDVLISPIKKITSSFFIFGIFLLLAILLFTLPRNLSKYKEKKWLKKFFNHDENLSVGEFEKLLFNFLLTFIFLFIFGSFVGTGMGGGHKVKEKIANNNLAYSDQLNFINGDVDKVEILGKNSSYVFYVTADNKTVMVTPIGGIVKSIEEVNNKIK